MTVTFTGHNIRLDDGTETKPEIGYTIDHHPWFRSAQRLLETVYPGDKSGLRLADLGCLEGGYAVEFARMGFDVLGLEIRDSNIAACRYVQERVDLPRLKFVQDDAWNIERHGRFDVMFCCGLYYHLDRPRQFLELLSKVTKKVLILQTHFSTDADNRRFNLSPPAETDGLEGRWYSEFTTDEAFSDRANARWSSWDNTRSFWVKREHLLQAIHGAGFDMVLEQFDSMAPAIVESMTHGYYRTEERGTFIGIKTGL
jgi:hypothetical protein